MSVSEIKLTHPPASHPYVGLAGIEASGVTLVSGDWRLLFSILVAFKYNFHKLNVYYLMGINGMESWPVMVTAAQF